MEGKQADGCAVMDERLATISTVVRLMLAVDAAVFSWSYRINGRRTS